MSDEEIKYETPKRIWCAQPRRKHGWKTHWSVEPVPDFNVTKLDVLSCPDKYLGRGHEGWKLFYHSDEVTRVLEKHLAAVNLFFNQDRLKGYPTGTEWIDLLREARALLDSGK